MQTRGFSRTIYLLSLVSLCTDMASEMLYPIMPVFLKSIGFTVVGIGLLEGIAEATAGLSKGYFGGLSDRAGKRLPFIQWGYALSALSKPMMALITQGWWIFLARTTDRLGKGLRTGARDAMLGAEARDGQKASVFGFHRAMDTMGAVLGPLIALGFLTLFPGAYRWLFLVAFLPGLAAIALTRILNEKPGPSIRKDPVHFLHGFRYWNKAPRLYKRLVAGLLFFALVNSSDVLLLLRVKEAGFSDSELITLYILYNLAYALMAWPVGLWADSIGVSRVFALGIAVFGITYACFAFVQDRAVYLAGFILYAFFAACTEGVAKAWISNLVPKEEAASAIGSYAGLQSIAALLASSVAGIVWHLAGPAWAFGISALVGLLLSVYFFLFPSASDRNI